MSILRIRDQDGNVVDIPALKGQDYKLTDADKDEIANKTLELITEAECIPLGSAENKLAKYAEGQLITLTAKDLEGIRVLRGNAFYNCYNLKTAELPNTLVEIQQQAFHYCTDMTSVIIPDSVTKIGNEAFSSCSRLENVVMGNGVQQIDSSAFYNCSKLKSIVLPDSLTKLGDKAFATCTELESISIPNGVTTIENSTFQNCVALTSVTLPENITSIGQYVFNSCNSLTNLTIPESIVSIDAFGLMCGKSTDKATITFLGTTPPTIATSTFYTTLLNKIIVPKGCGEAYKTATNWANYADYIEEAAE